MKKLLLVVIIGAALTLSVVPGLTARTIAQTTPPTPPATPTSVPTAAGPTATAPPVQGAKRSVLMYVDTVQGAAGSPAPAVGCSQTNLFRRGQQVVFRMWGVNVKLGGAALTPKNVTSAVVIIPGLTAPIQLTYGQHGKAPNPVVSFWSAAWKTTADTPLGVVNFTIVVKTKAVKVHGKKVKSITSKFSQQGLSSNSQLTITP